MRKLIVFCFLMGVSQLIFAQVLDTLRSDMEKDTISMQQKVANDTVFVSTQVQDILGNVLYYEQMSMDWFQDQKLHIVDTSLYNFYEINPNFAQSNYYQTLGNTGLASQNMFFNINGKLGFNYQKDVFNMYNIKESDLKLYKVRPTYSKIFYRLGPNKDQIINVDFAQRIYKKLILGLDVDIINSVGAYFLQKAQNRRVGITANYATENDKYVLQSYYIHNKHDVQENGGIANDTIFNENIESDRLIYTINLYNSKNLSKNATLFLRHSFELGNPLKSDVASIKSSGFNLGKVEHQFKYYRQSIGFDEQYNENNLPANFYPSSHYNNLITNDTVFHDVIENTFSWKNSSLYQTPKSLGFDFGITYRHIHFKDTLSNDRFNQIVLHGSISKSIYKDWKIGGKIEYVQGNINANDFKISGRLQGGLLNNIKFSAYIDQINRGVDYFYQHFNSNHFIWNNHFDKENIVRLGGILHLPSINVEAKYLLLSNYVFLNKDIVPEQITNPFSVLQFHVNPDFRFRKFQWISHLYIQKSTREEAIHVPLFSGKTAFTYTNTLFNKALMYQVGLDAQYHTNYYADYYMPALRSFYRQNDLNIGNFVYGSVFITLQIKRVNLLFKYRNISQGLTPYNYYGTPHYPLKDRGFEFAISWRFYD